MLLTNRTLRLRGPEDRKFGTAPAVPKPRLCRSSGEHASALPPLRPFGPLSRSPLTSGVDSALPATQLIPQPARAPHPQQIDPLYLFACHMEWELREDTSAAWEVIAAAESGNDDTRAQARDLLSSSRHLTETGPGTTETFPVRPKPIVTMENDVKTPYGLEIIENCSECTLTNPAFVCGFSHEVRAALDLVSHKSILPAGAILFVEGQVPRGMFVVCSGKVNLSTTSREGKILILKTAVAGEALGLSAAISGLGYETTAETATPCQLNFVDCKHLLELMQAHSEVGVHAARCLSHDFHLAYRDIHDLVLSRSSAGKLARLLLAQTPSPAADSEARIESLMTHEEMAQRIGSSRETVTRLLSELKKRQLIRLDGSALVIRDRNALQALAV